MLSKTLSVFIIILLLVSCDSKTKKTDTKIASTVRGDVEKNKIKKTKQESKMKNLDVDYCMGKFEPKSHSDFIAIPNKYADRSGMYMRSDAYSAFEKMYADAKKEGVNLVIRSAARNFNYQKGIWERKWTGATKLSDGTDVSKDIKEPIEKALKILEYSSMPGTSRHHWGTDIDLNAFNNEYFEQGKGKHIYEWLTDNASKYGFCQPYTPKGPNRLDGYNEEKWHWSYQPISQDITVFAEQYMKNEMVSGFLGAETASDIDVVKKYILGINHGCRH